MPCAVILSTQPAGRHVLLALEGWGWDIEEPFCPCGAFPGAGSGGTLRRKSPLSENNLLRREDLGLTLTETGLEEPALTGGVGRPGGGQGHSGNKL